MSSVGGMHSGVLPLPPRSTSLSEYSFWSEVVGKGRSLQQAAMIFSSSRPSCSLSLWLEDDENRRRRSSSSWWSSSWCLSSSQQLSGMALQNFWMKSGVFLLHWLL